MAKAAKVETQEDYLARIRSYRYVIYARQSTDEETGTQFRSLDDQIAYCRKLADDFGLNVVSVIREDKSAKKSFKAGGERFLFYQLMEDLENGKYDGIIAYHPDRLSRNTYDSGNIVDMLDRGLILDLKFPTTHFDNNASGKLMLNILFAMAKEYSEKLGEGVKRGLDGNFDDGFASGSHKWGYDIDQDGKYVPNESFGLIKKGWEMVASGEHSQADVIKFWQQEDLHYWTKGNRNGQRKKRSAPRKVTITPQIASKRIFQNTFYYGVLRSETNGTQTDLREAYNGRFQPMIDEATYNAVQAMSLKRAKTGKTGRPEAPFSPFRQFIRCSVCRDQKRYMSVGVTKNPKGKGYMRMWCVNPECPAKNKSIRMNVLLNDLYEKLERFKFTEKDYIKAKKYFDQFGEEKIAELRTDRDSKNGALKWVVKTYKDDTLNLNRDKSMDAEMKKVVRDEIQANLAKANQLRSEIAKIDEKLERVGDFEFTAEEFLNIANIASDKMKAADVVEKDAIARLLLLNIDMGIEKAPTYYWKEPFSTLLNQQLVSSGADERT